MMCPNCQSTNPAGARFCANCGHKLETNAAPRLAEGERKLVTVLFADVVGSTAIGERLDPEQVTDVMNGAFAFLNAAVSRYDGTVARLMGDAVLAIFGAPLAHEDDPERAIRAGLDMQAAAREYAVGVKRSYGVDFHVRVGMHTGLAVLDQVGDNIRAEYTAMGDTPNLAARMQSAAAPGEVLVSAETYRLARHAFDFEPRGAVEVKGKGAPVEAWRAAGVKAAAESARGLEGLRAPMVGRAAEVDLLRDRLRRLRPGGPGHLVTVIGEAGLGKSRLLAEARQWAAANLQPPPPWLEGRAISYGQAMSYLPWQEIIRRSIDAHERDTPEAVRAKLKYAACDCCHLPDGDLPFLEAMLAVAGEDSLRTVAGYSGESLAEHMTESVRGYLCGAAREMPFVMVFEDLHWADEASVDLLENVCELLPEHPLLILCLLRADRASPAWGFVERTRAKLSSPHRDEIALQPLSADQSRELLGSLLHIEDLPETVRGLILEKSEGNPFFVEEVIRSLLDGGYIVRQDGRWRATSEIVSVAIPNTLAGVLAARIDRLPETPKRVAQMSAVIGRAFAFRVLEAICSLAPAAERIPHLEPHLAHLVAEELVRERAREPELEYTFKHALTQEAAYNSLLIRRRKEFHGRAGQALESLYAGRLEEHAPTLAHHFWHAEDWDRAAAYSLRAGQAAMPVYAMREAIRHFDRAGAALDRLPAAAPERVFQALMHWSRAAFAFKPYPEQLERLQRAEQIARQLNDKRRLVEALYSIGAVRQGAGHGLRAMPVFAEAFRLAEELGDEALSVTPSYFAAFAQMDADPQLSVAMFDRAIALARKYDDRDLEAYALSAQAMALARLGRFAESREALQAATAIVRETGSPLVESDVELFSGWAYLDMGDPQRGLEHGRRGVDLALATDNVDCICGGMACLGFAHMQSGNLPEAAGAFREAIERTKLSGALAIEAMASGGLALTALAAGAPGALEQLEAAVARARELDDPFTAAGFEHAAAQAYLGRGDLEQAEARLAPALDYYRRNRMQPYLERAQGTWEALERRKRQA